MIAFIRHSRWNNINLWYQSLLCWESTDEEKVTMCWKYIDMDDGKIDVYLSKKAASYTLILMDFIISVSQTL